MTQKNFGQPSRYRNLGLIGRGQFGKVFCARNRQTGKLVALKELDPKRFPTNKFLRELRFLLSLQHENIVSCVSLEHSKSGRYLVMEYCEAGTLREILARTGCLHPRQAIQLVIDILAGLDRAHNSNIIHCDIKPENVLLKLTATGWQAKVSDFGIARLTQESDLGGGGNTGSPGYMAPERFYGQFSVASDLYAVGVILYELLLARRPFSGKPAELMVAHMNQRVIIPDAVPPSLQAVLLKSLEKLPGRRFSSASLMQQALIDILNSKDINLDNLAEAQKSLEFVRKEEDRTPIYLTALSEHLAEKYAGSHLTVLSGSEDSSVIYSANNTQLQRHKLASQNSVEPIAKFEYPIVALVPVQSRTFVVTQRSIQCLTDRGNRTLYRGTSSFHWAISPGANWLATAIDRKLQIDDLIHANTFKLEFADSSIAAIAAIDRHHLAVITHKTSSNHCRILVISRRGNVMWKYYLPATIAKAISSSFPNRIILLEAINPNCVLLVDLRPYRAFRVILNFQPLLISATVWGYIIVGMHGDSQSILHLLDLQGQDAGRLIIEGKVSAIAPLDLSTIAVSIENYGKDRLCLIDLKKLDVDLIF